MAVSERRVCRVLGQHRSTQRKAPRGADDEVELTEEIIALARQYGRYGYRRVTALLRDAGWHVNRKRVERIWLCFGVQFCPPDGVNRRPKLTPIPLLDLAACLFRIERAGGGGC